MFTGIIQAVGRVTSLRRTSHGARLTLEAPGLRRPIADGASVAVSGVCLTVVSSDDRNIAFDVVPETLSRSKLGRLSVGDRVNLEPSLRVGDPMDGHTVQGHIDGTAVVKTVRQDAAGYVLRFEPEAGLMDYIIPKGSIAVDGVSLTVAATDEASFEIALIPTTLDWTTLCALRPGDTANIETDILARTIVTTLERWKVAAPANRITMDMLREKGFA